MSSIFSMIGLYFVWVIGCMILGAFFNFRRAKASQNINDKKTAFMKGFALGPVAILGSYHPKQQAEGSSGMLRLGGIVGTACFLYVFSQL